MSRNQPLIYLSSPYSNPDPAVREQRFAAICRHAAAMMRAGKLVFSPIAHTHPIAQHGELPTGFDYWREYNEAMLDCCEELHVLMLDGWRESVGVAAEIKLAELWGLKIVYCKP